MADKSVFAEAGRRGARLRWGERRIVRLDSLDADTARLIRALLAQNEKAATGSATVTAEAEGTRDAASAA